MADGGGDRPVVASWRRRLGACAPLLVLAIGACAQPGAEPRAAGSDSPDRPPAVQARRPAGPARSVRDLSIDESLGGHTLTRHVGKSDAELAERLQREPRISSASTYTDRDTAERVVGGALASSAGKLDAWGVRSGRRPNLVLHYSDRSGRPLGRSLSRSRGETLPCTRALIVLRWDERRDRFYVLTSYPEADR